MVFAHAGRIVAILALILGILRVAMGLYVASIDDANDRAIATARYLMQSSGATISEGIYSIGFAIALGILSHIGLQFGRKAP